MRINITSFLLHVRELAFVIVWVSKKSKISLSSSPFLLNATVRHHLERHSDTHGELVTKVLRSIYVDDVVTGSQSEERAYELYTGPRTY